MKRITLTIIVLMAFLAGWSQEVSITGNKFTVDGNEIWFNGINTPWHKFVDFGRTDFEPQWWEDEFARYAANNINLARVWIHCSGEVSPDIDETGYVTGASDLFWEHMDYLFDVSRAHGVYVMPALLSFDITKDSYSTSDRWRAWLQSPANIQSYIDNVLIPMVQRYEDEPYLLAWEICNEPEWMFENSEHGPQAFEDVQRMHAMFAAAIHENSSRFVTTGSAAPKWNAPIYDDWGDYEGNMFSDEALSASINNSEAYLDFYQYHWYPWQTEWMESPFSQTTVEYGVDDRPVIVGESEGNDVCDQYLCQTVVEMYENAYQNGFDGVCAWKTPQNDGHGTFENIAVATNEFYSNHPTLVYPEGAEPVPVTGVDLSEASITIETGDNFQLTATVLPADALDKRVTWTSSNPVVASVSGDGLVSGVTAGSATVTVTTNDGDFTASCAVTVEPGEGGGGDCSNPTALSLPYTQQGEGEYCWVTSGDIEFVNSWGMDVVEINGVDLTNSYTADLPARVNGNYFIYYSSSYGWSNLTIEGSGGSGEPDIYYQLTSSVVGMGSIDPSSGSYLENSSVNLTATPASGYSFVGWSGDAGGTSPSISITMNADKNVVATFEEDVTEPVYYELTVNTSGNGSVSITGGSYEEGSTVDITATPDAGYVFDGWTGDASGASATIQITMDSDKVVTANFVEENTEPAYYDLDVTIVGVGIVEPSQGTFEEGSVVTLVATPGEGWEFGNWTGDVVGATSTQDVVMGQDISVIATFVESETDPDICLDPIAISIPFVQNGEGTYCWVTNQEPAYVNSWNLDQLTINGVDYTNTWSNSMPAAIDGQWYIQYSGSFGWSHFEAPQAKAAESANELTGKIKVFPNPFNSSFTIDIQGIDEVSKVEIVNSLGQVIQVAAGESLAGGAVSMELNKPGGTYIIRIHTSEQVYTRSIFKL